MTIYTFYQIVCKDETVKESYVGSTVCLKDRKITHKYHCINPDSKKYNFKVYKFIRDNGGWFNWKFVILDTKECINEYEAYRIEKQYINELKSALNSYSPLSGLTKKEYYKQYRQDHKENIKKKLKQYRQENKEKLSEKAKQYREDHKEKILQQKKEPYCCLICKGHYTHSNMSRHFTLIKHLKHLNLNSTASIE